MADVGFGGTDKQRIVSSPALSVHGLQRFDFDRIAQGRAGAVGFHIADIAWGNITQRLANYRFLRQTVGRGQTIAGAVLIDRRTAYHG